MRQDLTFLFDLLKKVKIDINENQFEYELKLHPQYPSLLSITETLTSFQIENILINISIDKIEEIPEYFAMLIEDSGKDFMFKFFEKKDNYYIIHNNEKSEKISLEDFKINFSGIVLLVEKSEISGFDFKKQFYYGLFSILYLILIFIYSQSYFLLFIGALSILGVFISNQTLLYELGINNKFTDAICSGSKNNCKQILNSKKSKLLSNISLTNLSLTHFIFQAVTILFFSFSQKINSFYILNFIYLLSIQPLVIYSIYYQNIILKKVCYFCLIISFLISVQFVFYYIVTNDNSIYFNDILLLSFILALTYVIINDYTKNLKDRTNLNEETRKNEIFKNQYSTFKSALLNSRKIDNYQLNFPLLIGNNTAKLKIILILSSNCPSCKYLFSSIDNILNNYESQVCFDIRFNVNPLTENIPAIYYDLISIYINDIDSFHNALKNWYNGEYKYEQIEDFNKNKIDNILNQQFNWNEKNSLSFTPAIIIGNQIFPKNYDKNDLNKFIIELLNDDYFHLK